MGTSDWIALGALTVSIVLGGLTWRTARRSAAAAVKAAQESARSAEASQRSAEVAERAEQRALAEREDVRGPEFDVGEVKGGRGRALAFLHDDTAEVRVAQTTGPELEKVVIQARGHVEAVTSPEGSGGHWLTWDRPTLHAPTTVRVHGKKPEMALTFELVLDCTERKPGTGHAHAISFPPAR